MNLLGTERIVRSTDGLHLAAYEGGNPSGPPVLFIHGYLFSATAFYRQFAGTLADSCRLIAFDLRGHGKSEKPLEPEHYASSLQWAEDISAVLNAYNIERATIVGWSLGSRVALNYAWTCGFDRIEALHLVAATLPTDSHNESAGLSSALSGLLAGEIAQREETTRKFVDLCTNPNSTSSADLDRWFRIAMSVPHRIRHYARSWALPYDNDFAWISCRTVITHGACDPVVPLELSKREAAAIQGADLHVIENAGHMPFFDQPHVFDERVLNLIRQTM